MPNDPAMAMRTLLTNLKLDKVALCNQGANSRADIMLTKSNGKEGTEMPKTFDELLALLKPEEAELVKTHIAGIEKTSNDTITTLKNDVATKDTKIGELTADLEKAKTQTKPEEDLLKSVPAEVAEIIKTLKKTNDDLIAEKAVNLANERFQLVKAIPCEEATLKEVLKSISPAAFEVLKTASATIEKSLEAKGKVIDNKFPGSADVSFSALEKAAKTIQAEDSTLTYEQAFTKACTANPGLYKDYVNGGK